jgi:hypothetical protein
MDLRLKKQFRGETNLDVFVWDQNNNVAYTEAYVNWLEKQLIIPVVMPMLLCIDAHVSWDITIGRKYELIEETHIQYLIINDSGKKDWIHKDWFKKSKPKQ